MCILYFLSNNVTYSFEYNNDYQENSMIILILPLISIEKLTKI